MRNNQQPSSTPLTTSLVYIFAAFVMISQFEATLWMAAFVALAFGVTYFLMMKNEKATKTWEETHPEEAQKNSFEERVKRQMKEMME